LEKFIATFFLLYFPFATKSDFTLSFTQLQIHCLSTERAAEWHEFEFRNGTITIVIPHTGPLYHGSLTMAGARLIASAGLTNRGLLSDQLRPVDGRFKLTTTMKTTFGICGSGTCSTASHLYDRIVYIRFHVNGMHIARHKLVNTGNTLIYR